MIRTGIEKKVFFLQLNPKKGEISIYSTFITHQVKDFQPF